ncbi:MAG: metal ABC transporter permease [Candidatus Omnitrophica bacterium]|nr:metal ABC transporter permease [Candidatus Omnitrophota bacterium]
MLRSLIEALSFGFMQRALWAGGLIALTCACLGVFLLLRRLALIGDGLAHVAFASIALALVLHQAPMMLSVPLVAAASLLILEISERGKVHGDAALGLVSSFAVAVGVILASIGKGFNVDLFSYLFGSILVVTKAEVWAAGVLCAAVLSSVAVLYHDLFALAFDEDYARASGVRTAVVNRLLVVLSSITVVLGIKLVGTMLVSSLIILPAAAAFQFAKGFGRAILWSAIFAVSSIVIGVLGSYVLNLPSGACVVLVNFFFFLIAFLFTRF